MKSRAEGLESGSGDVEEVLDENTSKLTHYDRNGRLVYYFIYTCDDAKRVIRHQSFNAKGAPQGKRGFRRTDFGRVQGYTQFTSEDKQDLRVEFIYDEDHNAVREETYDENDNLKSVDCR